MPSAWSANREDGLEAASSFTVPRLLCLATALFDSIILSIFVEYVACVEDSIVAVWE